MSWLDTFFASKNYGTMQYSGTVVPPEAIMNFLGGGVTIVDDPTNGRTNITISGGGTSADSFAGEITPEFFGAIGDGSTDDQPYFDLAAAAITAGTYSGLKLGGKNKNYKLSTGYDVPAGSSLIGPGTISNTADIRVVRVTANDCILKDFIIIQNFAGTVQAGVSFGIPGTTNGPIRGICQNVKVYHSGKYAFLSVKNPLSAGVYSGVKFIDCEADLCDTGFFTDERGEYSLFQGCQASQCTNGIVMNSGNFRIADCNASGCTYGVTVTPGTNDAHSEIIGTTMNHCTTRGLKVTAIQNGLTITGCNIFESKVELNTSKGVGFFGNNLDVAELITTNATGTYFGPNRWVGAYANTLTITGTAPLFAPEQVDIDGNLPSSKPDLRDLAMPTNTTSLYTQGNAYSTVRSFNPPRVRSTNNTIGNFFIRTILDEAVTQAVAEIKAIKSDGSVCGVWILTRAFRSDAGTVTAGSLDTKTIMNEWGTAVPTLDNSTTTLRVRYTGEAATNIDWTAVVTITECPHA